MFALKPKLLEETVTGSRMMASVAENMEAAKTSVENDGNNDEDGLFSFNIFIY